MATTTAPTPSSKRDVLARRWTIASTRAVAAPPAVALPVSDNGGNAIALAAVTAHSSKESCASQTSGARNTGLGRPVAAAATIALTWEPGDGARSHWRQLLAPR